MAAEVSQDRAERPAGPPAGVAQARGAPFEKPVFDETWATIGIGAGLVPSYSGSDDMRVFPLPLIVGRVGGIGISPNGPGFNLDLLSAAPPANGPPSTKPSFSFGPAFRFRNDRANQVEDEVVELAEPLDTAFEIGASAGISFPGVLRPGDRLGVSTQVRWDVLGAHDGMLVEPSVSYFTPVGRAASLQLSANAGFVDDSYADYYYSVTPAQSADTGLPEFTADGGLDLLGLVAIGTYDLDGNALNGGFSIYAIGGYSRLQGDGADTPFTSQRGSADQFLAGLGVGYTF
ncbi:MAG: MipA/OmpV family protein [Pseudomonadota bacterium]